MLIKKPDGVPAREVTPEPVYRARRTFLKGLGAAAAVGATGVAFDRLFAPRRVARTGVKLDAGAGTPELAPLFADDAKTSYEDVTTYNNFYEFGLGKDEPAVRAKGFVTRPWTITIDGACAKPRTFDLDELRARFPLEDRTYRFRCVEGWSMVVPWLGWSLGPLLALVEPTAAAKFVRFETLHDPTRMPLQGSDVLAWPYVEGLRIDEANHPLAILAFGLYGEELPPQNGAPARLIVPWKYGFKSIKSIVRFSFVDKQPVGMWEKLQKSEYGFWANVNPDVPHPRWSQATERLIGSNERVPTQLFNGYGEFVAAMYEGMQGEQLYL